MRKLLKQIKEQRRQFFAVFERYGSKSGWNGSTVKTILLKNVSNGEQILADHIWFTLTKGFEALGELNHRDQIEFDARVKEYQKGYVNPRKFIDESETDLKLSHPTKIRKRSD